jgi:chromosome segregation ATPase
LILVGEVDEFQTQFRMVQQKLSEAEAALNAARQDRSSKDQLATDGQKKCQELSGELRKVESERDEHKQQASQLQQRMNVTMQQVAMLQTELQDKQSQLTSTQVRLKQVRQIILKLKYFSISNIFYDCNENETYYLFASWEDL